MSNQTNTPAQLPNVNRLDNNGGYYDYLGNHYVSTSGAKIIPDRLYPFPKTHPNQYPEYLFSTQELHTPGSQTNAEICQAIIIDSEGRKRTAYVFKKDVVEVFRARETGQECKFVHKSANPITIEINGKRSIF